MDADSWQVRLTPAPDFGVGALEHPAALFHSQPQQLLHPCAEARLQAEGMD